MNSRTSLRIFGSRGLCSSAGKLPKLAQLSPERLRSENPPTDEEGGAAELGRVLTPSWGGFSHRAGEGSHLKLERVFQLSWRGFSPRAGEGSHPELGRVLAPHWRGFSPQAGEGFPTELERVLTSSWGGFSPRAAEGSLTKLEKVHTPSWGGFSPRAGEGSHSWTEGHGRPGDGHPLGHRLSPRLRRLPARHVCPSPPAEPLLSPRPLAARFATLGERGGLRAGGTGVAPVSFSSWKNRSQAQGAAHGARGEARRVIWDRGW